MRPAVPPKLIAERFTLCRLLSASTITPGLRLGLLMMAQSRYASMIHPNGSGGNFDWFRSSANFSLAFALLWRLLPAYFPLSSPLKYCVCNYPQKQMPVKAERRLV